MGATWSRGGSLLETPLHVAMLGLDSAGKTTALYRLKFDQYVNTVPTIGFNCEHVKGTVGKIKGASFTIWDVGGQEKVRPLWKSYTRGTDGIVFVVDSVDVERMDEARMELLRTAKHPENISVPILVLANKQDLPDAKSAEEVEKILGLQELGGNCLWHVQPTCAIIGEGLQEGLEVLYEMIIKRKRLAKLAKKKRRYNYRRLCGYPT
ncbi:ADP-ribosylation factor-like protein 4C isoform X1 [Centruroides sculpturatus]|uniref:ADP-ribosylation factor-like protein 4C isoform X1 n=1 Tax=Centruroides sculpturatus TaxID=218467 RepID=UPI000C6D99B2|nr:ADP-ribosylation factor-like protein 4C isoform X1 [Centruroides sculpturatus]